MTVTSAQPGRLVDYTVGPADVELLRVGAEVGDVLPATLCLPARETRGVGDAWALWVHADHSVDPIYVGASRRGCGPGDWSWRQS